MGDLVKLLRENICSRLDAELMDDAADRIDELEAKLAEVEAERDALRRGLHDETVALGCMKARAEAAEAKLKEASAERGRLYERVAKVTEERDKYQNYLRLTHADWNKAVDRADTAWRDALEAAAQCVLDNKHTNARYTMARIRALAAAPEARAAIKAKATRKEPDQ